MTFLFQNQGEYSWSDNWAVTYTHWGDNEPSQSMGGGCVAMTSDGRWYDTTCASKLSFVCKTTDGELLVTTSHVLYSRDIDVIFGGKAFKMN